MADTADFLAHNMRMQIPFLIQLIPRQLPVNSLNYLVPNFYNGANSRDI